MDSKLNTYRIGDIAQTLGISQRTLRYYEELGFLTPSRSGGGFRLYSQRDVNLLRMILRFKDLGLSLDQIRTLTKPETLTSGSEAVDHLRTALQERRAEFREKLQKYREGIEQIEQVLHILSDCATCGSPMRRGRCEDCLHHHGAEISPLLAPLLNDEENTAPETP